MSTHTRTHTRTRSMHLSATSQKQLGHLGAPVVGGHDERCATSVILGVDLGTGGSIGYRGEVARGAGWWCRGLGGWGIRRGWVSDAGCRVCGGVRVVVGEVWADPHLSAMLHENLGSGRGVLVSSIVQGGPVGPGGVGGVDLRGGGQGGERCPAAGT